MKRVRRFVAVCSLVGLQSPWGCAGCSKDGEPPIDGPDGGVTHLVCSGSRCVTVPGEGPDECRDDTECGPTMDIYVAVNGDDKGTGTIASPFATLDRARDRIRAVRTAGGGTLTRPVNVSLRGGTYRIDHPFTLDVGDSGTATARITYRAYSGEQATLSGGREITGPWRVHGGQIFVTNVGSLRFNSLFVGEKRAVRARTPNVGTYSILKRDKCTWDYYVACVVNTACPEYPAGIPAYCFDRFPVAATEVSASWKNLKNVEVVLYRRWEQARFRIDHIAPDTGQSQEQTTVFLDPPTSGRFFGFDYYGTDRYYVENLYEGLDSPGEWYLDDLTGDLYYWPLPGESVSSVTVVAPIVDQAIRLSGRKNTIAPAGSFSISHWVKTTLASAGQMYTVGNAGSATGYRFGLSGGRIAFLVGDENPAAPYTEGICGSVTAADGQWHLITGAFDRDQRVFRCFVDRAKVGEVPLSSAYPKMSTALPGIGTPPCCTPFVGDMDELRIHGRALGEADVAAIYENTGGADGLLLHLAFEGNLTDLSGNIVGATPPGANSFVSGRFGRALHFEGNDGIRIPSWGEPIRNITIRDLTIAHTDWLLPRTGYPGCQAACSMTVPAAVGVEFGEGCSFEDNTVAHVGGHAVDAVGKNLAVRGNDIFDMGAGGLRLGQQTDDGLTQDNELTDNRIRDGNVVFKEGVGVWVGIAANTLVAHNLIYNMTYSGISVGWAWQPYKTSCRGNVIEKNVIHHVMTELDDGAGIYVLGLQPGTKIRNNLIHDIDFGGDLLSFGIYLDGNSSEMTVSQNVVYRVTGGLIWSAGGRNTFDNNVWADASKMFLFPCGPPDPSFKGYSISRNVFYGTRRGAQLFLMASDDPIGVSDFNLFHTTVAGDAAWNLADWKAKNPGREVNSLEADPLFVNYGSDNFSLRPTSPAFKLGFVPIDVTDLGPR